MGGGMSMMENKGRGNECGGPTVRVEANVKFK